MMFSKAIIAITKSSGELTSAEIKLQIPITNGTAKEL